MISLRVWLRDDAGALLRVGEIRVAAPDQARGGALRGQFRYDPGYLEDARAYALDPIHLALGANTFDANRPRAGIHGVFEDSLPDAWGRGLLIRRFGLARSQQSPPYLLARLGRHGLGALAYGAVDGGPPAAEPEGEPDLAALVAAALSYDDDPASIADAELAALFRAASSPGGARPKLVLEDRGRRCIAKLGSSRDGVDMVRVEAACLALARRAGLSVPDFRIAELGPHAALLVERFDCAGAEGRRHMLSMQTLLGADDWYQLGYADLADVIRRVSARPEVDLPALYRQAVFNALIGNTDDHLKNFTLLRQPEGWRLSPAYDLTPDEPARGEHVLHFGACGCRPDAAGLAALARAFGLSRQASRRIRDEAAAAVAGWRTTFAEHGVSEPDIARLASDLERRLVACADGVAGYRSG
jgi:serine/threonine-protein kinase HipA